MTGRPRLVVITTSYPEFEGDAQGHFVASEVRRSSESHSVTVLAPGHARGALGTEKVVSLGGGEAFGFPGALARLQQNPWRALAASRFVRNALSWLSHAPLPERVVAHFLLPCGVPIATRAVGAARPIEVVVHGSDARLFAALPGPARRWLGEELLSSGARLRFVSSELERLFLGGLGGGQRQRLQPACRVEPCAIDVGVSRSQQGARQGLGIPREARIAVVVARLVPSKRVDVALEACSRVHGLRCLVIGDGPERARLQQRYPQAEFVGHVPRPRALEYLAAADALVSASLLEGAPTVVREARALGTPVVCLNAGDVARWAERDAGIHVVSA